MALITGGNTTHYWEDTGIVGKLFQQTMAIDDIYLWDVWFIYQPGIRWTDRLPPRPDFAMHQLGRRLVERYGLPVLDSKVFADKVGEYLANVPHDDRLP